MNELEFFNNKELWNHWYDDSNITSDERKVYRELMNIHVLKSTWRTTLGVTLDWNLVKSYLDEFMSFSGNETYKSFHLDFHHSYLPKGKSNIPSNYCIELYHEESDTTFEVPIHAVMTFFNAGWPRHGFDPRKFINEPYTLLKPIQDFIEKKIDINGLIESIQIKKLYHSLSIYDIVYERIYPLISRYNSYKNKHAWLRCLKKLYKVAILINQKEFLSGYATINPYIGISKKKLNLELINKDNPFLKIYKESTR